MSPSLMRALQLADSAFPSGGFAYSWGLEAAVRLKLVSENDLRGWLLADLEARWSLFDRRALAMAYRASAPVAVDHEVDLRIWAEPLRTTSAEAGQAFLTATARLGNPAAQAFRQAALGGQAAGHLPVAQGAVFRSMGLGLEDALAVSAHAASRSVTSAAVRLGLVGAIAAQEMLFALTATLSALTEPPDPHERPASFAPLAEIATLSAPDGALFAN